MAGNWHVNPDTGNPGRCRVDWSNPNHRGCPHGLSQGQHFETAHEAIRYYSDQRDRTEDLFHTESSARAQLAELRAPTPEERGAAAPQYISKSAGEKSFWGRNGMKIGGAVVATFVISTIASLALSPGDRTVDDADAIAPQGDSSVSEEAPEPVEEPLPEISEDPAATPGELGTEVGETIRETGERIGEEITPERIDRLKEFGQGAKDFLNGLIGGSGLGDTFSVPVPIEVSEGVQFQGQSLQPSAEEIAAAQATLAELEIAAPRDDAYYNRVEQFGRSFETGVVGRLEHRDIPQATFKNDAPQARAISGSFVDPYTGETVQVVGGSSSDTDVDHIVPLKEVIRSESSSNPLSQSDRISIANDFDNLQVVGSSINRSKGDRDPGAWMPPNQASHLRYAIATINVKAKYNLTIDSAEHAALSAALQARQ